MAYDPSNPYQPPRRPTYPQNPQEGFYDDGYAPPPSPRGQRALPGHFASPPQNLRGHYERGGRGGRPGPGQGMPRRGPGAIPRPDGPYPTHGGQPQWHDVDRDLSDGMRDMNVSGGMHRSASEQVRGGPRPGYGSPRGRMPPPGRGRGPPPGQRMPPPRAGTMPPDGRGYPPPRRMPVRQNIGGYAGAYEQGWDESGNGYYQDGQYDMEPEQFGPPQRSMTMPTNVPQPQQQYMAYNPSIAQSTPTSPDTSYEDGYAPASNNLLAPFMPNSQYPRQSVNALIDEYNYQEPQQLEEYNIYPPPTGPGDPAMEYRQSPVSNFSRPVLDRPSTPGSAGPYGNGTGPNMDFAQQAHRSRSQPNLRERARAPALAHNGTYQVMDAYDGTVEVPAVPQGIPPSLRLGQPALPASAQQSRVQPPARQLPASSDDLPHHPSPADEHSAQNSRYSNPDSLPAHPTPVRPGLMHQTSSGSSHPPPRRQYSPERGNTSAKAPEESRVTRAELAQLQSAAKMNTSDSKLQLTLAKKLVEAASVLANEGGKADAKTTRKNREGYINDAHKIVKRLAGGSHPYPDAMFFLASCHGEGALGLQIDHERAFNLYQSAAKMNHPPAAYRTAVCCELGAGTKKDPIKAMTWYKKAALLGETPAMFKLGMILLKGLLGQPRNPREGLNWLKRAADQADEGNQHALHELGLLYEGATASDILVPDANYARELFVRAAELSYPASQFRLGNAYEYGHLGCPIDPRKSIFWYSKAAMLGDLESMLSLSGWYLTGAEGVIQQSDTEAYLWARKAAEKGLAKAEYALGYFTEVGIGVPANLEEAKRWYYKAAQRHPKAQQRLQELKKGGVAAQKSRERLSRSNSKHQEGECIIM